MHLGGIWDNATFDGEGASLHRSDAPASGSLGELYGDTGGAAWIPRPATPADGAFLRKAVQRYGLPEIIQKIGEDATEKIRLSVVEPIRQLQQKVDHMIQHPTARPLRSSLEQFLDTHRWEGPLYGQQHGWTLLHKACSESAKTWWMTEVVTELFAKLKVELVDEDFVTYVNEKTSGGDPIGCTRLYPSRRSVDFWSGGSGS